MLGKLTNSQIAERHIFNTYPCLQAWIDFVTNVNDYLADYDAVSCVQIAMICKAVMKTVDYILANDATTNIIRVSRMMHDLHDSAWENWTSFSAQSRIAEGIRSLGLTSVALQGVSIFNTWDNVLNNKPSFSPPTVLNNIMGGITV